MDDFERAGLADGETGAVSGFFGSRWRGEVPLGRLLWRDTLLVATALNVIAATLALVLLGQTPDWLSLAVHFALLPYNLFLGLCVWRTAERNGDSTVIYMGIVAIWLALVNVI